MFGSLIMFASGFFTKSPNSANASLTCWLGVKCLEKFARILLAREMSMVAISIPHCLANA